MLERPKARYAPTSFDLSFSDRNKGYRGRYWNEEYFNALNIVQKATEAAGLTMTEVALRWMSHHSLLNRSHGDAIIIGASRLTHIKEVSSLTMLSCCVRLWMKAERYIVEPGRFGKGPTA